MYMDFVVFSSVLLPYLWVYGFVVGTSSGLVVFMLGVPLFSLFVHLSVHVCCCLFTVYFIYPASVFTFSAASVFTFSVMLFVFFSSVSVFTCFVCLLNRKKGFCCLFFSVLFLFVVPSASVFAFLVCACCLFISIVLFLIFMSFKPSLFLCIHFSCLSLLLFYFLSYLLFILSLLWEGGSRVDLTKEQLIIYDFLMCRYFRLAAILMLEHVTSFLKNNINTL